MKNLNKMIVGALAGIVFSACSVTTPVLISDAELGDAQGVSKSTVILGNIYLNGKYGIKDAAENGMITSAIATIDEKVVSYFLFSKRELIVTAK